MCGGRPGEAFSAAGAGVATGARSAGARLGACFAVRGKWSERARMVNKGSGPLKPA